MVRRATEQIEAPLWPALSAEQVTAAAKLAAGKTPEEAATVIGVTVRTVMAWRRYDPAFQAELNSRRADIWRAGNDRLRALVPKALDALEGGLAGPEGWKVALAVLKLAGVTSESTPKFGPETLTAVLDAEGSRRNSAEAFAGYHRPELTARQLASELYRELEGVDP
jgi:hypothetical protein